MPLLAGSRLALLGPVSVYFADAFTRADSASTMGNPWVVPSGGGTWGISTNQAYSASDVALDVVSLPNLITDGTWQVTLNGNILAPLTNARYLQFLFRYLDSSNFLFITHANSVTTLNKRDGGANTQLATAASTTADATDYVIKVVCIGPSVQVLVDGVSKHTTVLTGGDTKYTAYSGIGFKLQKAGVPTANARADTLTVDGTA